MLCNSEREMNLSQFSVLFLLTLAVVWTAVLPAPVCAEVLQAAQLVETLVDSDDSRGAPVESEEELQPVLFEVPAPRGIITDRYGEPLAVTKASSYLAIRLQQLREHDGPAAAQTAVMKALGEFPKLARITIDSEKFAQHWEHRPLVPFPLTESLSDEDASELEKLAGNSRYLQLEAVFTREYPAGESFAHVVGYLRPSKPFQHGPLSDPEMLWPPYEPVQGLEKALENKLAGKNGVVSYIYTKNGELTDLELIQPAVPGQTIVTSLVEPMQRLAYDTLKENGRPGAFVAVDSISGDILALASYPSFNPGLFTRGISAKRYQELQDDPANPLIPRATMSAYPPGSTFKPIVALAALDRGAVSRWTRLPSPSSLDIDGRTFRNWNSDDEGMLDVRYALLRSSNTWFYQAGMRTGGPFLLSAAKHFGLGHAPGIELPTSAGNLPEEKNVLANQAVANFAIGQGEIDATPLQMALAMAGLSSGTAVPEPRLVIQTQDPLTNAIIDSNEPRKFQRLNTRTGDRTSVRSGMWGVVNHDRGTGKAAAHPLPQVYGKTGTAQWKRESNVAWFVGYVGSNSPRIAFACMVEGKPGESLSGGKDAAPLVGKWVNSVYSDQEKYHVEITVDEPDNPFSNDVLPGTNRTRYVPGRQLRDTQQPTQYPTGQGVPEQQRGYPETSQSMQGRPIETQQAQESNDRRLRSVPVSQTEMGEPRTIPSIQYRATETNPTPQKIR